MPNKPQPKEFPIPMPTASEWGEGRKRVLALIRDFEAHSVSDMDLEADMRNGRPQTNVLHAHLFGMMTAPPGIQAAFSSILTSWLANISIGDDAVDVEKHSRRGPIAMIWPATSLATVHVGGARVSHG